MVAAVHERAAGAGQLEQRAEGGQLAASAQQFLDAGIDDVGQVVAGARRLDAGPRRDPARRAVVAGHAHEAAHERREADAVGAVAVAGKFARVARQSCNRGDVVDDLRRHIDEADDAAEVLECLEQDQQCQTRAGVARLLPREGELGRLRRERLQLGRPRLGGQARVGSVGQG